MELFGVDPAAVVEWHLHSLRHTGITLALDAGVGLRDVQDYAGHKDPRTTRRYDHSRDTSTATPPTPCPPT